MADLEIRLDVTGLEAALQQCNPQQVYTVVVTWFDRASKLIQAELKARAPGSLSKKTYIRMDTLRPPRWARISVKSPLTWLIEGGTGSQGDPSFRHVSRHWPSRKRSWWRGLSGCVVATSRGRSSRRPMRRRRGRSRRWQRRSWRR
jgi:hypothetical protein